jgi:ubiquitin-conjugating enzyme (huntingtin interacting protein 2)
MANKQGRLVKELEAVKKDETSGVKAKPVLPGNLQHLKGEILGPEGTVYDGGVFDIDIIIPANYPFEPPKMKFITKIWHPNISSATGAICLVRTIVRSFAVVLILYLIDERDCVTDFDLCFSIPRTF